MHASQILMFIGEGNGGIVSKIASRMAAERLAGGAQLLCSLKQKMGEVSIEIDEANHSVVSG